MNQSERDAIKLKIAVDIENTLRKIATLKELTQPIAPENAIGRLSRMDAINNKSINQAALKLAEEKLIELNTILPMVDGPQFGICRGCQSAIPIGRIMVMPHRRFCVGCSQ